MKKIRYIKSFEKHLNYADYIASEDFRKPNVSLCLFEDELHYNPFTPDYSTRYLTTIALDEGAITFNIHTAIGTDKLASVSYSTDDGATWTTVNNQDGRTEELEVKVNVHEGDKVLWKGSGTQTSIYDEDYGEYYPSYFSSTCGFDAEGNIMSLCYGDDFADKKTLTKQGQFAYLFSSYYVNSNYDDEKSTLLVNAGNISLPATALTEACYLSMFDSCGTLTKPPQLPATTLSAKCYENMFHACISMKSAPVLPATEISRSCYTGMFQGCKSLRATPDLPATTLQWGCYTAMFNGCESITAGPALPATALTQNCYQSMFAGCTSLRLASRLPATSLAVGCYNNMFGGCTSLKSAPALPATTLVNSCYIGMFIECTSLVNAPDLPAETLANRCYQSMFTGCRSLSRIKAMFTTTPGSTYTSNWVEGVAAVGTFVKNENASWDLFGTSGVPEGWTVEPSSTL